MNYFGIDWGKNKVGVALGSDETNVAVPFDIVRFDIVAAGFEKMEKLVKENLIDGFVIGVPTKKDLSEDLRKFIDELKKRFALPVYIVDEKVTTKLANKLLAGRGKDEDSVSAMIILQNFLDGKKHECFDKN
jgi:putative Holliday junction resolvase